MRRVNTRLDPVEFRNAIWKTDASARTYGCLFLGFGIFLGALAFGIPSMEALGGRNQIMLFGMATILAPVISLLGLCMVIVGKRLEVLTKIDLRSPAGALTIVIWIALFGLSLAGALYFQKYIASLGYRHVQL